MCKYTKNVSIYNHLIGIGYKVDVDCVTLYQKNEDGKTTRTTLEVDSFVITRHQPRCIIERLGVDITIAKGTSRNIFSTVSVYLKNLSVYCLRVYVTVNRRLLLRR